jgi:glycosyltransferase involved in cell wall biosynthesis
VNIVHVSGSTLPSVYTTHGGGQQRRIGELAAAQVRAGHTVIVYSPGDRDDVTTRDGVGVHLFATRDTSLASRVAFLRRTALAIRREVSPSSVVHFHGEPEVAYLGLRHRGAQVLSYDNYRFRGLRRPRLRAAYRRVFDAFDALCPCSRYCAEESAAFWGLRLDCLTVLYNGVNTTQFAPDRERGAEERRRLGMGDEDDLLLYVGRVTEQKGSDLLLDALPRMRTARPSVRLVVAGPIEQFVPGDREDARRRWTRRFEEVGATYLGPVPEERLAGLYNAADVFVMPTRELEMFGMAAVEAQACGTPVVASDHGGLRETVPLEVGGRFRVNDPNALAETVLRVLSMGEGRTALGERARQNASAYSWDRIASDSMEIYETCLERRTTRYGRPNRAA